MNYHPFEIFILSTILVFLIQTTARAHERLRSVIVLIILERMAKGSASFIHGRRLRVEMERYGVHMSGAGFYQMMSRLENAKLVQGESDGDDRCGRIYRLRQDAA